MKKIDLSIVIVSYNTFEFTSECIQSVVDNVKNINYEIIVVDNDSKDSSPEKLKKLFPRIILVASPKNLGFSKANNLGVRRSKGGLVLFLNSDTVVYPGALEHMVKFMGETRDAGAATCFIKLTDGKLDDAAHRGFPTPWRALTHFSGLSKIFPKTMLFNGYHLGYCDLDKLHAIDALAGAFMIVKREAGEEVGWWDEDYFFYGEDIDFCYKLSLKGWKVYFDPSVSILHYKGVSGGIKKISKNLTTADMETKKKITIARFNAMKIFYKKHYHNKYSRLTYWAVMKGIDLKKSLSLRSL